jgi:hypothetical protein
MKMSAGGKIAGVGHRVTVYDLHPGPLAFGQFPLVAALVFRFSGLPHVARIVLSHEECP